MVEFADYMLYAAAIATVVWAFYYFRTKDKKKKGTLVKLGLLLAMVWLILFLPSPKYTPSEEVIPQWDEVYAREMASAEISDEYLYETEYYDYSNSYVQDIIKDIKKDSDNYEQAAIKALDYIYNTVPYNGLESDDVCFNAKGSSVIKSRTGQCDTQTIAVITLLRGMGLAARPVGGCIYKRDICKVRQSLLSMFAQVGFPYEPPKEPKFQKVELQDGEASRSDQISRGGGLHAWGEVWFPGEGWVTFESTTGELVRGTCYAYDVEMYPDNDDKKHICVSTNRQFALYCAEK